jgi:hypothetical protein
MATQTFRDPVRNLNPEVLGNLELVDTRVYPLQGGTGRRWTNEIDPRHVHLIKTGTTPVGDDVTFYEHIASIRDKRSQTFYVAFRETADAQYAREKDLKKFPKWVMDLDQKQAERLVHIYMVMKHPSQVAVMRSHEDWLAPIGDPAVFDACWHFLAKHNVVKMA